MLTDLDAEKGFGKGRVSAAQMNWRSIANFISPLLFAWAFGVGNALKERTGIKLFASLHYFGAIACNVVAEGFYRTLVQGGYCPRDRGRQGEQEEEQVGTVAYATRVGTVAYATRVMNASRLSSLMSKKALGTQTV